jgi:NADPH:quinone reductase-like Zn-dependent oxidoreductase
MKAVVMHEYGAPDVLKYEDVPDPVPGAGEVLVRVAAAGINPVDLVLRTRARVRHICRSSFRRSSAGISPAPL